jgi:hypothetical protein
MNRL